MNLTDLKTKPTTDLLTIAETMGLENMARSRKQDIIFAILKASGPRCAALLAAPLRRTPRMETEETGERLAPTTNLSRGRISMSTTLRTAILSALMLASLAGYASSRIEASRVEASRFGPIAEAPIETGRFKAVYSSNLNPGDWSGADALTADVDRQRETVVLTLADGSQKTLYIGSRPKEMWPGDCATFDGYVLSEVADLSPAPLVLPSVTFTAPLLYAKCGRDRLVLSESPLESGAFIAFNRVGP
jgi:hypothetical protein